MKKGFIIPAALFIAVFCTSFFFQRYTLAYQENTDLFLLTPDWLREVFSQPLPLSNFTESFLKQFYSEPVTGPMIPATVTVAIYLCLNCFLRKCRVPFHRLAAIVPPLALWCLTATGRISTAIFTALLISVLLGLVSLFVPHPSEGRKSIPLWEMAVVLALIAGSATFTILAEKTRSNEEMAKVSVCADKNRWEEVLTTATPEKVKEQPLMLPYALLALNSQGRLCDAMFRYPVTGLDCLDLGKENSAFGDIIQSYAYEMMDIPNEAVHQIFQFSTNFDHGMTHLSLRRLIRLNVNAGRYRLAVKYAEILRHNLFYRIQAERIIGKYGKMPDISDSLEVQSSAAPVFSQDPVYDMMQLIRETNTSAIALDRFGASLLLERNLEDFITLFYNFDWRNRRIPNHYQEALLLSRNVREDIRISPEIASRYKSFMEALARMDSKTAASVSRGTYWEYYYRKSL